VRRHGVKRGGAMRPRRGGWGRAGLRPSVAARDGHKAQRATTALGDATRDCSDVMWRVSTCSSAGRCLSTTAWPPPCSPRTPSRWRLQRRSGRRRCHPGARPVGVGEGGRCLEDEGSGGGGRILAPPDLSPFCPCARVKHLAVSYES
jgi:hypothetical protein